MRPECISAVNAAAGRKLSDEHIARIEAAVRDAGVRLAQADRERWAGLSREQRTAEVGAQAIKDLQAVANANRIRSTLETLERAREHASAPDRALVDATVADLRAIASATTERAAPATTPMTYAASVEARMKEIATNRPEMQVILEGGEKMSAREAAAQIEREFSDSVDEAQLASVASECFARSGYVPAAALGFRGAGGAAQSAIGRIGEKALDVASVVLNIL